MHSDTAVELVTTEAQLFALRDDWGALYRVDSAARVFQSWSWVRGLAKSFPGEWSVLVVRSRRTGEVVALLPFGRRAASYRRVLVERLAFTGGRLGDSTGLVVAPGYEEAAITSLASYLNTAKGWDTFTARDVADDRLRALVERLAGTSQRVRQGGATAIPFIELPAEWESYLAQRLTSRRREDLRRAMRAIAKLPSYCESDVSAATFDADFSAIIRLRAERWQTGYDADMRLFYPLMRSLFDDGMLWLRVFRSGSEPVAAIGGVPDRIRGVFWYYWGVFNAQYAKLSPGKAAMGIAIRHAIEAGFHTFSLTYGDEPYKATFGTEEQECRDLTIRRPSLRAAVLKPSLRAASRVKRGIAALQRRERSHHSNQ